MYHRMFMMFMFESIFDHKFNISDLKNNVDVDIFTHIYDHTDQ